MNEWVNDDYRTCMTSRWRGLCTLVPCWGIRKPVRIAESDCEGRQKKLRHPGLFSVERTAISCPTRTFLSSWEKQERMIMWWLGHQKEMQRCWVYQIVRRVTHVLCAEAYFSNHSFYFNKWEPLMLCGQFTPLWALFSQPRVAPRSIKTDGGGIWLPPVEVSRQDKNGCSSCLVPIRCSIKVWQMKGFLPTPSIASRMTAEYFRNTWLYIAIRLLVAVKFIWQAYS